MLEDKIYQDYIAAFKARDKEKSQFLSFLRSEIKNAAKAARTEKLEDGAVLSVLNRQKKRLEEALKSAAGSSRSEFIESVKKEISILSAYLPQLLGDEELSAIIDETITEVAATSLKDMGKVMKQVLAKVGVRADAKKVSEVVKNKLSS